MRTRRSMRRKQRPVLIVGCVLALCGPIEAARADTPNATLPEFTQTSTAAWINSPPLTVAQLRGHVVLLHVWAFECWNCYRSFPWLNTLHEKYESRGVIAVGIHSPEFPQESERARVIAKTGEYGLRHAVMMDNDHAYWRALGNQYWPAWYVVDAHGRIRAVVIGEAHAGDPRARAVESEIDALLAEQAGS